MVGFIKLIIGLNPEEIEHVHKEINEYEGTDPVLDAISIFEKVNKKLIANELKCKQKQEEKEKAQAQAHGHESQDESKSNKDGHGHGHGKGQD